MSRHLPYIRRFKPAPPPPEESAPWAALTISQALQQLAQERQHSVTKNTLKSWRRAAAKFHALLPGETIQKLTSEHLTAYKQARLTQGAARTTINQELQIAARVIGKVQPYLQVGQLRVDAGMQRPGIALTDEQISRLISAAAANAELQTAIRLGLSGLRIGEILSLRAEDLDATSQTITIQRGKTAAAARTIPLNEETYKAAASQAARVISGLLFPHQRILDKRRRDMDKAWSNCRRAADLKHIRFHDLRHTAITRLCEAGVPDWTIRAYVGHTDPKMMERYSHPRRKALELAASALKVEGRP